MKNTKEVVIEKSLFLIALSAIFMLFLIAIFIFKEGTPLIFKVGFKNFVTSSKWFPLEGQFGIFSMILGTLWITAGALIIGVPLGLSCAIFLSEFVPRRIMAILKPTIELLAGIPSVVYGFIGMVVLVPLIRENLGGPGLSILAGSIILGIMILPTIISISIDAIQAVPRSYREGSLAMGATKWQTIHMVVLKAARSGIVASIILGMGRAIGETMAVIMVAGNAVKIPRSILDPARTLTTNIALEMGFAAGDHRQALFATGVVLFIIIMILNIIANYAVRKR
ncbi:phosphate ABC transporter permease subunit PstC [Candidatus Desantisbacteria bacterium CG1_02_38_46]|uniref:Phosphate transport system permease protein n=3 Tax=unclassified Candidatus Desantisiibacteriota TaxID=3106372 RepID=A0A2H9PA92_9BACT|nr:MAG: phosphate ABC transporter permease subunit PstC [Candidatus Desantisbacteria bacterium CG1_02_38_46]PIU51570.1 MAG: phosphate ABC transporter permease subunit PstC [Candidatus Desantisbacteria bacterium CG07_land_8_20_14_0_80_39_15]PIZ15307.1 MAG: phosphate ABC transporter permease subunit PstC [Candidatus Desantisbacteria bacterium CG_4_10_14_0_8_um_filter_39_17]